MKIKRIFALILTLVMMCSTLGCFAAENDSVLISEETGTVGEITLQIGNPMMTVSGKELEIYPGENAVPVIVEERTLVPIRAIIEAMGGTVSWDGDKQEVTLTYNEDVIKLTINSTTAYLNGAEGLLDVAPITINDRTMLPIRYIAEGFNFRVKWIEETQTVTINPPVGTEEKMENKAKTAYPGGIWEPGEAQYTTVRQDYIPVEMDDGIILEAQVLFPADKKSGEITEEKFPVVVEFTPYGGSPNQYLAEHGYISALVHMRGTYNSEGEVGLFSTRDVKDAENVVNWAAYDLARSDGRVAFIGSSMPAGTALAAASGDNVSPLKAIIAANNSLDSVYKQCWAINGIPTTGFYNYTSYASRMYGGTEAATRFFSEVRENIMSGGDMAYYGDFWQERLPLTFAEKINNNGVPVLLISGIEDIMDVPVMKTYTALQNAYAGKSVYAPMEAGQEVTPKYQVIMGKWGHGANLDMGLYLQWLETWVKGVDTGLQNTTKPMHLWEGGSDKWYNTDCYPITNQSSQWYLADGGITTAPPIAVGSGELVYTYPHEEKGKLIFESEPLSAAVRIAGPISASVYASTTGTNLVLVADFFDEAPGGDRVHISRGVILGSMSEISAEKSWTDDKGVVTWPWQNLDKDIYLEPDTVYQFDIPLGTRSWKLDEGHKLVIEVTTKSPIDVLPENGVPARNGSEPGYLTETQMETIAGQEFTLYYGGDYPSAINLPVIPEDMFTYVDTGILPVIGQRGWGAYPMPLDWDR